MLRFTRRVVGRRDFSDYGDFYLTFGKKQGRFGICFIPTNCTGVVERFSNFNRTATPGLTFYIPFFERIRIVPNQVSIANYTFEAKTQDNIFVELQVAVRAHVDPADAVNAMYHMSNPMEQIHSFLDSEIRAQVSRRELDRIFTEQEEISHSIFEAVQPDITRNGEPVVKQSVYGKVKEHGFTIDSVLIRHIEPATKVKEAMNEINASQRMREAAKNTADAHYITTVREAEADRDRKRLQGEGMSLQRLAIMKGYEDGINAMTAKFGLTSQQVIDFVLKTQHLDTVETIGKSHNSKVLFLEHNPAGVSIRNSILEAMEVKEPLPPAQPSAKDAPPKEPSKPKKS